MSDHLEDHLKEAREDDCDSCGLSLKRIKALESSNAKLCKRAEETQKLADWCDHLRESVTRFVDGEIGIAPLKLSLTAWPIENVLTHLEKDRDSWKEKAGKLAEALEDVRYCFENIWALDRKKFETTFMPKIKDALSAFRAAPAGK